MNGLKMNVTEKKRISIIIPAYNEENNIGSLIKNIQNQKLGDYRIFQILVVASGCTDNTVSIIKNLARKDRRITLISERERRGKAPAINLALDTNKSGTVAVIDADISLREDTILKLVRGLQNKKVGAAFARPVPVNTRKSLANRINHFIWDIHHEISLENKGSSLDTLHFSGKAFAFKHCIGHIPEHIINDDMYVAYQIVKQGLQVRYVPESVVYTKEPSNLRELIYLRKRIRQGHKQLENQGARIIKARKISVLPYALRWIEENPKEIFTVFSAILIDTLGYLSGWRNKPEMPWRVIASSKVR